MFTKQCTVHISIKMFQVYWQESKFAIIICCCWLMISIPGECDLLMSIPLLEMLQNYCKQSALSFHRFSRLLSPCLSLMWFVMYGLCKQDEKQHYKTNLVTSHYKDLDFIQKPVNSVFLLT